MEWKRSLLRLVRSKIIVNPGRAKPFYVVNGKPDALLTRSGGCRLACLVQRVYVV